MQPPDESWHLKHKGRKGHIILTFQAKLGTLNNIIIYAIGGAIELMHTLTNLRIQHPTLDAQVLTYHTLSNTSYVWKKISILKNARFSGKGRQSLHMYIYVMRIRKNLTLD